MGVLRAHPIDELFDAVTERQTRDSGSARLLVGEALRPGEAEKRAAILAMGRREAMQEGRKEGRPGRRSAEPRDAGGF